MTDTKRFVEVIEKDEAISSYNTSMKKDLKERLIQTMFESLYHEGYSASNLNALLKKAGTSKGGLYHHYGSKKELALETIEIVLGAFIEEFWKPALEHKENPIDAIEELLGALPGANITEKAVFDFQYGCPLNNLIQEMSGLDEDFSRVLNTLFERWTDHIALALEDAVKRGVLQEALDVKVVSEFITASIEGCLSMAKVRRCEESYKRCTRSLIGFLRTKEV